MMIPRTCLLLLLATCCAWAQSAREPRLKWSYEARSNLYAPPLAAEVCPSPGNEIIISDSEVRRLRCLDAKGNPLWEYNGGWTKRLTSAASLSRAAVGDQALLIVGNNDGTLCCVNAATGAEVWRRNVGGIEWGAAIWADLNGDGRDEAIAGTETNGIAGLDGSGAPLWTYKGEEGRAINVRCPIAAADVDGDKKAEVFAADRWGPLCLNGDGTLRWRRIMSADFVTAVAAADADRDGKPELYCSTGDDNATYRFDALTGETVWKFPMVGAADVYPSSSLAIGDVNQDGKDEVVVADALGYVYCLTAGGENLWTFVTAKRTHAAPSLGDVDGDESIEVLVACGDHNLYCLDSAGQLKWRFSAKLRLISPATIADVDQDGKTDILFGGSDHTLRCLTLDGRYRPELVPWGSRRFDAAQSGSSFGKRLAGLKSVEEREELLANGGFERARAVGKPEDYPAGSSLREQLSRQPQSWRELGVAPGAWQLDSEQHIEGKQSLKVTAQREGVSVAGEDIPVDKCLRSLDAAVAAFGEGTPEAAVVWTGPRGVEREDKLAMTQGADGWRRFAIENVSPPREARFVRLVCVTPAGGNPMWWDDAHVVGRSLRPATLRALVNQVGYDIGGPKWFTAQSNFTASNKAAFEVVAEDGRVAFSGQLEHKGRIKDAYGNDWGFEYWRGDFTALATAGKYRVRITLDDATDTSWPFEIAPGLLWAKTSRAAYRFFYYERCGMAVAGFHGACHLDDAASPDGKRQYALGGGWHDAGDYNPYDNTPYVLGLVRAFTQQKSRFDSQDEDKNGLSDFLDEILWGGDRSRRMVAPDGSAFGVVTSGYGFWGPPEIETDNVPGTGDERRINGAETGNDSAPHAAALARIARLLAESPHAPVDKAPFVEAAVRALEWGLAHGARGPLQLSAAVDLYAATGKESYAALAKEIVPNVGSENVEELENYDAVFGGDHRDAIGQGLVKRADEMLLLAENPFGLLTHGPMERPNFLGTPADTGGWHVGNSSYILTAATQMAMAYLNRPDPRYLRFVYDQFNWILGNNPYDISLMEGQGSANPPTYHHRYAFSGVPRGAVPGSIVNGITWRGVGDDRPYLDVRGLDIPDYAPNEVWLPHNTAYLNALAQLQEASESASTPGAQDK